MRTLGVEGSELAYELEGVGPLTLAFAHGWCSHRGHWLPQVQGFARDHSVLRWDRRGMGDSTAEAPAASAARHADDLVAILDYEGIERVVVAGHAGGGPTALHFATAHADRTEALVMVDTTLYSPDGDGADQIFGESIRRTIDKLGAANRESGDTMMARMYAGFFGPAASEELRDQAIDRAVATDRQVAIAEIGHMLTDTASLAAKVTVPTLWISARPDDTERMTRRFTSTDLTVGHVIGSGHFVQVEVPDQVNAMLRTFLAQLSAD